MTLNSTRVALAVLAFAIAAPLPAFAQMGAGDPVPAPAQLTKDSLLIGPSERYDLALVADNPGVWMVHCHMEHHMANGMMTLLVYEGYRPTGPMAIRPKLHRSSSAVWSRPPLIPPLSSNTA